jgi:hypothetical protein
LPFLAAALAPVLTRALGHNAAWVLAVAPLVMLLHFLSLLPVVAGGTAITGGLDWIPSLGVRLDWLIDGLSLTFAFLITGIGTFIVLYAGGYLKGHPQQGRFFAFILLFMGAMLGLVLADSFLTLFVFWELTSITSFLLIGFDHEREASAPRRLQALVVTGRWRTGASRGADRRLERRRLPARCRFSPTAGGRAAGKPLLHAGAAAGAGWSLHQVGASALPLLAAERHGGTDPGVGLPALGDDGEGRRLPADAAESGPWRHRAVDDRAAALRRPDAPHRRASGRPPDRPQTDAGATRRSPRSACWSC